MPAKFQRHAVYAVFLLTAAQAQANWTGKGEVGIVMARGNSETETGNAKLDLVRESKHQKHNFTWTGLYGETGDVISAQRWDVRWQTDWKLTEHAFWFGNIRYEDDRFSGFDYQTSTSTGAGYTFFDTPTTKLQMQLGAGYRRLRNEVLVQDANNVVIARIQGDTTKDLVANGAMKFEHSFTSTTQLLDSLLVESGQDNTQVQNDLALQVKMNASLALAVGYSVRNNSHPPQAQAKTDMLTTLNLVYQMH